MIRKLIISFLLATGVTQLHAFTCFNLITGESYYGGGNSSVHVPLDSDLVVDITGTDTVNEYADIDQYFSCKNDLPSNYTDWFYLRSFTPALNPALSFGVQVNGTNYFDPAVVEGTLPYGVLIQEFPRYQAASFPLNMKLIMKVKNRPGNGILVKKGDLVMILHAIKFAWIGNNTELLPGDVPDLFDWSFYADNDIVLTEGTCDINEGELILVNLGTVHRSRISGPGGGLTSDGRQNIQLTYQCKNIDGSIDTSYAPVPVPIRLYISAIPTSFSSGAVQTREGWIASAGRIIDDLGVEFYHNDKLLVPNDDVHGYFKSFIQNGRGGPDTLTIAPVKNTNSNQLLEAGEFNAVATVVMTLD